MAKCWQSASFRLGVSVLRFESNNSVVVLVEVYQLVCAAVITYICAVGIVLHLLSVRRWHSAH